MGDAIAILQNATKVAQEIQEEVLRTGWGGDVVGGSKSSKSGTTKGTTMDDADVL